MSLMPRRVDYNDSLSIDTLQSRYIPVIQSVVCVRHRSVRSSSFTTSMVSVLITWQPTIMAALSHVVSVTWLLSANHVVPRPRVALHISATGCRRRRQTGSGIAAALAAMLLGHDIQLGHVVCRTGCPRSEDDDWSSVLVTWRGRGDQVSHRVYYFRWRHGGGGRGHGEKVVGGVSGGASGINNDMIKLLIAMSRGSWCWCCVVMLLVIMLMMMQWVAVVKVSARLVAGRSGVDRVVSQMMFYHVRLRQVAAAVAETRLHLSPSNHVNNNNKLLATWTDTIYSRRRCYSDPLIRRDTLDISVVLC